MAGMTSIIILTYNQLTFTRLCLGSLNQYTTSPYELILVDNGSTDGTPDFLQSRKPARVILNQANLGFSRGVNQGIRAASGKYILLLNNDTLPSHNWLTNLLRCINSDEEIGIVGPRTNYGAAPQGGLNVPYQGLEGVHRFSGEYNRPDPDRWFELEMVVGFCMLIRREVIDSIGLFDESYQFGMFEDKDFCRRTREAGFKLYCAGDTFVYHFGSITFQGSSFDIKRVFAENHKKYKAKWGNEGGSG